MDQSAELFLLSVLSLQYCSNVRALELCPFDERYGHTSAEAAQSHFPPFVMTKAVLASSMSVQPVQHHCQHLLSWPVVLRVSPNAQEDMLGPLHELDLLVP